MRKDYLRILGVSENATDEEIKKAWKKKALQFHPDKNPSKNAEEEFIKVCEAYEKLSSNNYIEVEENLPKPSQEFYKKYNKNLTPEEVKLRLQKAREHAKYKEMYEENILTISFENLKKSFFYKFSNTVGILSLLIGTLLLFDYSILEPKVEKVVILNHSLDFNTVYYTVYDLNESLPKDEREYTISSSVTDKNHRRLKDNSLAHIYKSNLLGEKMYFSHPKVNFDNSMKNKESIYFLFWAFLVIFYLPIFNFIVRGPNTIYLIFIHLNAYLPIFAFIGLIIGLL